MWGVGDKEDFPPFLLIYFFLFLVGESFHQLKKWRKTRRPSLRGGQARVRKAVSIAGKGEGGAGEFLASRTQERTEPLPARASGRVERAVPCARLSSAGSG